MIKIKSTENQLLKYGSNMSAFKLAVYDNYYILMGYN